MSLCSKAWFRSQVQSSQNTKYRMRRYTDDVLLALNSEATPHLIRIYGASSKIETTGFVSRKQFVEGNFVIFEPRSINSKAVIKQMVFYSVLTSLTTCSRRLYKNICVFNSSTELSLTACMALKLALQIQTVHSLMKLSY